MQSMDLQALIFDVDGTLADTEELHRRAFNGAFRAANLDWDWTPELYVNLLSVTGGKERILHFTRSNPASTQLEHQQIAALHRDKNRRYAESVAAGELALRTGVRRLLAEALQSGLRLAIATTTSRENVDALLTATQQGPVFEIIAAGDQVSAKKPGPDIYSLALEQLDLDPAYCIAVEDSVNGLRSALAAGLSCVVTRSSYGGEGPFSGALAVVTSLGDPGETARSIAGWPLDGPLVDIPQLLRWHRAAATSTAHALPPSHTPPPDRR